MRSALAILTLIIATPICGGAVIIGALLGLKDTVGSVFDLSPRWWGKALNWAGGVELVVHGGEYRDIPNRIIVANHVSLYDVTVLLSLLTRGKFVAKAELASIPLFGRAVRSAGMVFIQRENRKAAFEAYREASERVREGASVAVFAEGTRGTDYPLRPFKKGPFVLAISSQAPIIPTVIHGTVELNPKGTIKLTPGRVDVHFLEPVPTAGLTYDDRDHLARTVRDRMAACLKEHYGIDSPPWNGKGG
jgi:1-acyl-sn-glycerol-3-phosphate acyltransferase